MAFYIFEEPVPKLMRCLDQISSVNLELLENEYLTPDNLMQLHYQSQHLQRIVDELLLLQSNHVLNPHQTPDFEEAREIPAVHSPFLAFTSPSDNNSRLLPHRPIGEIPSPPASSRQGEHAWKDVSKAFCSKFSIDSTASAPPQFEMFPSLHSPSPLVNPSGYSGPSSSPEAFSTSTRVSSFQSIPNEPYRNESDPQDTLNSSGLELRPFQNNQLGTQLASPIIRPKLLRRRRRKTSPGSPLQGPKKTAKRGVCRACGTTNTPEWRKGPDGSLTLCNACGLNYVRNLKKEASLPVAETPVSISIQNLLN